ncbi:MAG: HlyD family secretion protein [Gammaproteobacteria bacterium]|jgi:membrane fusion protein, multidrug efflux system
MTEVRKLLFRSRGEEGKARLRLLLLIGGPLLVLIIGGYLYITGGRYVSSEDAYVQATRVNVAAEVAGRVVAVAAAENQPVHAGELLFRIDDSNYRLALQRADAHLQSVRNSIDALRAQYQEKQAELAQAREDISYFAREFARRRKLAARHALSASDLDQARHQLDAAKLRARAINSAIAQVRAQLGSRPDLPTDQQPQYLVALAARDQAALDLKRTEVRAPIEGIVGPQTVEVGDYVTPGEAAFSLVEDHHYVKANLKETELTYVHTGQQATITVDAYPGHVWHARVASISPATGAEFSLLPAQNATGNWVKVVQRVPVRLALAPLRDAPRLRAGMSVTVTIDTGHRRALLAFIRKAFAESPTAQ